MSRRHLASGFLSWMLSLSVACGDATTQQQREPDLRREADQLFAEPTVHALALTIDPGAMAELAREPKDWVRATLHAQGKVLPDVSVRFKGHRSLRSWAEKPAFKVDVGKGKHEGRRAFGLRRFALNNMVEDPSMLREQLGARVFSAVGVPAPRATYAELTINGERYGLYTLLESIDESMLARHFEDASGPTYEGEYGCDVYPQDVWGFEHDGGRDDERKLLHELARGVSESKAGVLIGDGALMHREQVLGYFAASTLLADFDGFRHAHNYHLFRDPESRRWSYIPWGFDRILKRDVPAFDSEGRIASLCFGDATCRLEYVKTLHAAIERFEALDIASMIERLNGLIAPFVARDPRRPYSRNDRDQAVIQLGEFVAAQPERLRKQLACWDGERELDADGDGYGCMDCNDADPAVRPGAQEMCDGVDNDCSGHIDDGAECGCPSEHIGDHDYALCAHPMSFWEAEQFCHSMGSTLAKIDSKQVLDQLSTSARKQRKAEWWVGLSDQGHEGRYVWPDQSRPVRGLWARGEPDNYACGQHCAALRSGRRRGLRDMHCATAAPFICSVDAPQLSRRE